MVSIYSLQRLMDRYWSNQNELSMVLVHIEKAYNKVPREILWKDLEGKKKEEREREFILPIFSSIWRYEQWVTTNVRIQREATKDFPMNFCEPLLAFICFVVYMKTSLRCIIKYPEWQDRYEEYFKESFANSNVD